MLTEEANPPLTDGEKGSSNEKANAQGAPTFGISSLNSVKP
jgi:hypothetical protein